MDLSTDRLMKSLSRQFAQMPGRSRGQAFRHLRKHGIEACGVDRSLHEDDSAFLFPTSWFEYPLLPAANQLLVSHLAFSSHLLYQHTTGGPELRRHIAL